MKWKQPRPGFELGSPIPIPMTVNIIWQAPPYVSVCLWVWQLAKYLYLVKNDLCEKKKKKEKEIKTKIDQISFLLNK